MNRHRDLDDHIWSAKMLALLLSKNADDFIYVDNISQQCDGKAKIVAYLQFLFKNTQLQSYQLFPALTWFFGDDLAKEIFYALDAITPRQTESHEGYIKRIKDNGLAHQVLLYQKH